MKQTSPRCFRWKPEGPSLSGLLKMKVTWTHFLFQMLEEGLLEAVFPSKIHPKAAQILIIQIQTLCVSDRIKTLLVNRIEIDQNVCTVPVGLVNGRARAITLHTPRLSEVRACSWDSLSAASAEDVVVSWRACRSLREL